ncbi:hypothetical protein BDZ85DRAFT_296016 [Elsinoe ampelina]|uniref:chitinase n=1 Tax=Elsinoe ampelina TaxID=302913 RepID=A0A6A6GDP1_9PEZI|nr:hypothetical protein BDZ85DRAFT_296016 [Elsinoe ampelina]
MFWHCLKLLLLHLYSTPIFALHFDGPLTAELPPIVPSALLAVDEALPHANTSIGVAPLSHLLTPRDLVIRADGSGQSTSAASSGDFTCGPNKPCGNGACCGESGWCGYSPTYCGTGCQSNCDAKAECGHEFGFCGTTTEFCAAGCQSNCEQPKPSGPKGNVQQKIIAYWESWNENKPCEHMSADEIPVNDISHLIYAFGFVNPGDFDIVNMPDVRPETFREVSFLKNKNPDLRIQVALGGWTHNDPGKWQKVFSDMVSAQANRSKFITNLLGFLAQYGFDGVDFDWEYPGAPDRGGTPEDGVNYTQLLKELRAAIRSSGRDYIVTYTAPTSYWYLRHFDVSGMNQYVDWINLMSYDLHGIWDADNPIGNQILAHTNLTEIDLALDLFWRNNIPPEDIVLGIGFYGRSFKLADKNCWKPGCKFESSDGGGEPGECTGTSGFLSYSEVMNILASRNAKSTYDKDAQVKYLTYGQNSWISYDDAETFQKKIDFANDRGLSGLMIWAIDLDDDRHSALSALTGQEVEDPLALPISSLPTVGHSTDDASQCRVTDCGGFCNQGETPVGRVKSLFGDHKKACKESRDARYVCCPAWTSLDADDCYWDAGGGAVQTDCSGKCQAGDIKLFGDSWGWKGDLVTGEYDYVCARGGKAFCCAAGNKQRFLDICTWSDCDKSCPSDKQNVLTFDTGGPRSNPRCDAEGSIGPKRNEMYDATKGAPGFRKLCCPKPDSFKNCQWKGAKVCSEQCDNGQITLDLDPRGPGEKTCDNGREQVFCCDAPGRKDQPFLPVDLDKLFPPEYLPPADALPQFELVGFNGRATIGDANPGETGVAFFLIAGSDTAVSSMRKRGDSGVVFLDCPADALDAPLDRIHTARVICLDADIDDCFKVQENGVEGTVVHMPNQCGNGSFSRAVSLIPSENQSIPVELARNNPTSAVYDFSFDYNMPLVRRDAGRFSIRMDYSNVKGYWDAVVDSPGVQKRDLDDLVKRFYSGNKMDWVNKFNDLRIGDSGTLSDIGTSKLEHLVYFEQEMCTVNDKQRGQGIAAAIQGELNAGFFYGFSMIATWDPASTVKVHQSAGFLHPVGTTSAAHTVSGIGTLDTSKKLNGASLRKSTGQQAIGGHGLYHGWASVTPYKEESVTLKSEGQNGPAVAFNGYMEAKIEADWGDNINVHFPGVTSGVRAKDLVFQRNSKLTPLGSGGQISGRVTIGSSIKLGIKTSMFFSRPYSFAVDGELPDLSVTQNVAPSFNFQGDDNSICLDTKVYQHNDAALVHAGYVGWGDDYDRAYLQQSFGFPSDECWNSNTRRSEDVLPEETMTEPAPTDEPGPVVRLSAETLPADGSDRTADELPKAGRTKKKRQNNSVPGDFSGYEGMPDLRDLLDRDSMNGLTPEINCMPCAPCGLSIDVRDCCECAWLPPDEDAIFGIIGSSPFRKRSAAEELHELFERARSIGTGRKPINFFNDWQTETELYPQYPNYYMIPQNDADWDGSRYGAVKKYFHNTTALCTSFDISQATTADVMYPYPHTGYRGFSYARGVGYHQMYQTEHVFEGQTLARFFNSWLLGKSVGDPRRRDESWIEQNIFTQTINTWGNQPLVNALADELGSVDHLDRLTVFMSKPNLMKGIFGGGVSISPAKFRSYQAGPDQLYAARQVGMIFTYLNLDTVWESFCDTYNGMLDLFGKFDQWYNVPGDTSHLADEWPKFIRAELDRVVKTARSDLKMMDQQRGAAGALYATRWLAVMNVALGEIQKIKLERTDKCRNLPASTAGRYTG